MAATYTYDVFSTLDGYASYGPDGDWGGYWGKEGPEFLEHRFAQYAAEQRMVFGANPFRMFKHFAALDPATGAAPDPTDWLHLLRHHPATVISSTLTEPLDWHDATIATGDAVDLVTELKQRSTVPLRSHGSVTLNRALLNAGLVDLIQVTVFPVISGLTGAKPIYAGAADFDLDLVDARTFDGRIQELTYRPRLHPAR